METVLLIAECQPSIFIIWGSFKKCWLLGFKNIRWLFLHLSFYWDFCQKQRVNMRSLLHKYNYLCNKRVLQRHYIWWAIICSQFSPELYILTVNFLSLICWQLQSSNPLLEGLAATISVWWLSCCRVLYLNQGLLVS